MAAPARVERRAAPPEGGTPSPGREGAAAARDEGTRSSSSESGRAIDRASRALAALTPGADGDVGARLEAVRSELRQAARSGDARANDLLGRLEAAALRPGVDGGEQLAALVRDGGLARQLAVLASAAVAGVDGFEAAREALLVRLLAALGASSAGESALGSFLASALGEHLGARAQAGEGLDLSRAREQLRALRVDVLESIVSRMRAPAGDARAEALVALARGPHTHPTLDGALARAWLNAPASGQDAAAAHRLLDALLARPSQAAADVAAALVAEAGRADAGLLEALGSLLAGREFEHAWNVARRELGDPGAYGFAVPDGLDSFATAELVAGDDEDDAHGDGGASSSFHLTLGVDFSALGPVRADLAVRDGQVAVRLVASEPGTAIEIRQRSSDLRTRLAADGRRVLLAVVDGPEDEAKVDARRVGVDEDDHVMDVEG
ncbi:MAG: flagellar hook-length control protein FliK [Planctomycetota bacterium]